MIGLARAGQGRLQGLSRSVGLPQSPEHPSEPDPREDQVGVVRDRVREVALRVLQPLLGHVARAVVLLARRDEDRTLLEHAARGQLEEAVAREKLEPGAGLDEGVLEARLVLPQEGHGEEEAPSKVLGLGVPRRDRCVSPGNAGVWPRTPRGFLAAAGLRLFHLVPIRVQHDRRAEKALRRTASGNRGTALPLAGRPPRRRPASPAHPRSNRPARRWRPAARRGRSAEAGRGTGD